MLEITPYILILNSGSIKSEILLYIVSNVIQFLEATAFPPTELSARRGKEED
jgi:hypothetical protein